MLKALVVDDSKTVRMVIGKLLGGLGYTVVEAADGAVALSRLSEEAPFDLAMVDWNMPVMTGIELLLAIQGGKAPAPKHIVMVTTETDPTQIERALKAGAHEYLMKPFTREAIAEKLALLESTL